MSINTAEEMSEMVADIIKDYFEDCPEKRVYARTFEEAGLLTNDRGLEIEIDGRTFQITVARTN